MQIGLAYNYNGHNVGLVCLGAFNSGDQGSNPVGCKKKLSTVTNDLYVRNRQGLVHFEAIFQLINACFCLKVHLVLEFLLKLAAFSDVRKNQIRFETKTNYLVLVVLWQPDIEDKKIWNGWLWNFKKARISN